MNLENNKWTKKGLNFSKIILNNKMWIYWEILEI